jgi:prophage antirepressor-like protein
LCRAQDQKTALGAEVANIAIRDFEFQGNAIRCIGTAKEPWFVAKDVAEALGIVWASSTLANIKPEWRKVRKLRTFRRKGFDDKVLVEIDTILINEAAVYKLAIRSNKPSAEAFTDWVASEVLPSIRKTGEYVSKRRGKYQKQGKQIDWVEDREVGIEARKDFTGTLKGPCVSGAGSRFDASAPLKILGSWLKMSSRRWDCLERKSHA